MGWLGIGLGIIVIIILVCVSPTDQPADSSDSGELKAAIIDQLYILQPNQEFIAQATEILEAYGFKVDLYQGDEVTVDLYRLLPTYGYKLIIFRAHSGLVREEYTGTVRELTFLFTAELYRQPKYPTEQLTDQLASAQMPGDYPYVFATNSKFITQSMRGQFDNTVIIMMGCSCLYYTDMAQAFFEKGASIYFAWSQSVGLRYVDEATINLISNLCNKKMTVEQALHNTIAEVGCDPDYGADLRYYPPMSGDKTIKQLIK